MWHKYWISAVRSDRTVTNARQKSLLATTIMIDKNNLLRIAEVAESAKLPFHVSFVLLSSILRSNASEVLLD